MSCTTRIVAFAAALLVGCAVGVGTAGARPPAPYTNCTVFNKTYPHGVGKVGAHDKTSGRPVTTFRRSNKLYRLAMSHNSDLDRDGDGIACEQA